MSAEQNYDELGFASEVYGEYVTHYFDKWLAKRPEVSREDAEAELLRCFCCQASHNGIAPFKKVDISGGTNAAEHVRRLHDDKREESPSGVAAYVYYSDGERKPLEEIEKALNKLKTDQ